MGRNFKGLTETLNDGQNLQKKTVAIINPTIKEIHVKYIIIK